MLKSSNLCLNLAPNLDSAPGCQVRAPTQGSSHFWSNFYSDLFNIFFQTEFWAKTVKVLFNPDTYVIFTIKIFCSKFSTIVWASLLALISPCVILIWHIYSFVKPFVRVNTFRIFEMVLLLLGWCIMQGGVIDPASTLIREHSHHHKIRPSPLPLQSWSYFASDIDFKRSFLY